MELIDHQKLTFLKLNRFYPLSKTPSNGPVLKGKCQKPNEIKIKWKVYVLFTLFFKIWKNFLYKAIRYNRQFLYFLLFYISLYTSFSQSFRASFNIIWKKIFVTNFLFLMDSLNPPTSVTPPPQLSCCPKSAKTWQKFFVDAP